MAAGLLSFLLALLPITPSPLVFAEDSQFTADPNAGGALVPVIPVVEATATETESPSDAANPPEQTQNSSFDPFLSRLNQLKESTQGFAVAALSGITADQINQLANTAKEETIEIMGSVTEGGLILYAAKSLGSQEGAITATGAFVDWFNQVTTSVFHIHLDNLIPSAADLLGNFKLRSIKEYIVGVTEDILNVTGFSYGKDGLVTTEESVQSLLNGINEEVSTKSDEALSGLQNKAKDLLSQGPLDQTLRAEDPAFILTPYDKIPNFGANPTKVAVQNGGWSDAATWGGSIPTDGDIVSIAAGVTVTYDVVSDAKIGTVAIQAGGHLIFNPYVNTRLRVTNLLVLEGGELQIGTALNPVAADVKAEVIFNNIPLDTTKDPEQYGTGLIGLGEVTFYGAAKTPSMRLAVVPRAGDTTLTIGGRVPDWRVGDLVSLSDARLLKEGEFFGNYTSQAETDLAITDIQETTDVNGSTLTVITLHRALQFNHDFNTGNPEDLPLVANFTRNIMLHSEYHDIDSLGTRGYTLFTNRAHVKIWNAQFHDLGRTRGELADNTTFDASGNVTHLGTNQNNRFALGLLNLLGPDNLPAGSAQFEVVGSTVGCHEFMNAWGGIHINRSSYGRIENNLLQNMVGTGIVLFDSFYNDISGNTVINVQGAPGFTVRSNTRELYARYGACFASFESAYNRFAGNLAAGCVGKSQEIVAGAGYDIFFGSGPHNLRIPLRPGVDVYSANAVLSQDYVLQNAHLIPIGNPDDSALGAFVDNRFEGAGATGLTAWNVGIGSTPTQSAQSIIKGFKSRNAYEEAFFSYVISNFIFDDFEVRNNLNATRGAAFVCGDYLCRNILIRGANVQAHTGIGLITKTEGLTIEDSIFNVKSTGIEVNVLATPGGGGAQKQPNLVILRNVTINPLDPTATGFNKVAMVDQGSYSHVDFDQGVLVLAYNLDGIPGNNLQFVFSQSSPTFGPYPIDTTYGPLNTLPSNIGAPVAGLTGQQAWDLYHVAFGGQLAGPDFASMSSILGLVRSTDLAAGSPPSVDDRSFTVYEDGDPLGLFLFGRAGLGSRIAGFNIIQGPQHGSLSPSVLPSTLEGNVSFYNYMPGPDYNGMDSFTYTATDDLGQVSEVKTIYIRVVSINDAPRPTTGAFNVPSSSGQLQFNLYDYFVDPDVSKGSLGNQIFDTITITSVSGLYGSTSGTLQYDSATGDVTINVPAGGTPGSRAGYFFVNPSDGAAEGHYSFNVIYSDSVPDTTSPTISAVASSDITSSGAAITWTTDEASDTLVEYGTTTDYGNSTTLDTAKVTSHSQALSGLAANTLYHFRVKSKDAAGNLTTSEDFSFTTLSNQAPVVAASVPDQNVAEDASATVIDLSGVFSDPNGDALAYSVSNSNTSLLNASLNGSMLTLSYLANQNGAAAVTVRATDTSGEFVETSFNVTVNPINDAPAALAQSLTLDEDGSLAIVLGGSDVDGDSLTCVVGQGPSHGTWTSNSQDATGCSGTYTANADYNGPDSFDFVVNDGTVDSAVATIDLAVTAVNDAPVADAQSVSLNEDTPQVIFLSATDADGNPLTYTIVDQPLHGILAAVGPLNPAQYTYTPAANFNGTDSFTFKVNDGTVDSNVATVSLTINAVNDAPVASDSSFATDQNTLLTGTLPASDVDGDALTYVLVTGPSSGMLTLNSDGSFTYTPNADFTGTDSFTYKVNDGTLDSNIATVSLTVNPVNAAPVISNVAVSEIRTDTATITWTTDVASTSRVEYGTSPDNLNLSAANSTFTTSHKIILRRLTAGTKYYFRVVSVDAAGNSATSSVDSTGAAYSFTTATSCVKKKGKWICQ